MDIDLKRTNLLDLRRSEKKLLAQKISAGTDADVSALWEAIEKTLSQFLFLLPENEEQIYFFGAAMRELLSGLNDTSIRLRQHSNQEVEIVFAGGFLGLSFKATLDALKADRAKRGEQQRVERALQSRVRHIEAGGSLLADIKEAVASLVPGDRH